MKRRSLLAAFLCAPALPVIAATFAESDDIVGSIPTVGMSPTAPDRNIGRITAGLLQSADGKMVIDFSGRVLRLSCA